MNENLLCSVLVLIPLHRLPLSASEHYSVKRTFEVLSKWNIAFLSPERLKTAIESSDWFIESAKVISYPDAYFESVDGYNRLLMSRVFYKNLMDYEHLLIVQPDALVISDRLAYWCDQKWSFIGAPWFRGFDKATTDEFIGVGNGGFSLRKVADCLKALESYSVKSLLEAFCNDPIGFVRDFWIRARRRFKILPNYNEDYFFGVITQKLGCKFLVPDPNVALSFAFEVNPSTMYALNGNELPFGCHAFERYDHQFWTARLQDVTNHDCAPIK